MTRSTQPTQAVSGQTNHRAGARGVSAPASMQFLGFEDNRGVFHWAIVGASGDRLVQAATFVSYEEAKQAAGVVRSGAVSAPSENRADGAARLELAARHETPTATDDLDAQRWLNEGGSFSSEAVTGGVTPSIRKGRL
jgi:hypothetical protein